MRIEDRRSDSDLVDAARAGDRHAFSELIERHHGLLERVCGRALRRSSMAAEASQEAVVLAMLNLDRLRRPDRFGPWLAGIGLNVCRRKLRERSRRLWMLDPLPPDLDVPDLAPSPEDRAVARDTASRVREAVADLPEGQRRAVMLFYLQGLTVAEVAEELGVAGGAVKVRLHDGRAGLRTRLEAFKKEEMMGTDEQTDVATLEPVEVRVREVRRRPAAGDEPGEHVVVLAEENGDRELRIWIGGYEAVAMAFSLEGEQTVRPWTYSLTQGLLSAAGGAVREARIERLSDRTFYATVVVDAGGAQHEIDARPSDAINLALVAGAPIRVRPELLQPATGAATAGATDDYADDARALVEDQRRELERTMARYRER